MSTGTESREAAASDLRCGALAPNATPSSPPRTHRFAAPRWGIAIGLVWIVAAALYLSLPPSPDQFEHAYMGWRLIQGDVPYRDFVDPNWPGVIAVHALSCAIFGNHLWSWRAFDFSLFALSVIPLAKLVERASSSTASRLVFVLAPLTYVGLSGWVSGQHDMTAAQFMIWALWFHVIGYEDGRWRRQWLTGLLLGLAILNKPTLGVLGLLLPIHALLGGQPTARVAMHTAVTGVSSVLTVAAGMGAVLLGGTTPRELWDTIVTYNAEVQFVGAPGWRALWIQLATVHLRWWPGFVAGAIAGFMGVAMKPRRSFAMSALMLPWVTALLSYAWQHRGQGYHLSPATYSLMGGCAMACSSAVVERRALAILGALACVAGTGYKLAKSYVPLGIAIAARDPERYLARFPAGDHVSVAESVRFLRTIEPLPPGAPVWVVGSNSAINFLGKRRQPTRFYLFAVIAAVDQPTSFSDRWLRWWEEDLARANPRYVLVASTVEADWLQGNSRAAPALRKLLSRYERRRTLGDADGLTVHERDARAN